MRPLRPRRSPLLRDIIVLTAERAPFVVSGSMLSSVLSFSMAPAIRSRSVVFTLSRLSVMSFKTSTKALAESEKENQFWICILRSLYRLQSTKYHVVRSKVEM